MNPKKKIIGLSCGRLNCNSEILLKEALMPKYTAYGNIVKPEQQRSYSPFTKESSAFHRI